MTNPLTDAEAMQAMVAREPIFHRPELGTTQADYARMTAPDYWEVGASGKVYKREAVLALLATRRAGGMEEGQEHTLEATGFACRRLGESCWLLTYHLVQDGHRRTRRSTVWEFREGDWRIVYHQGTVISG